MKRKPVIAIVGRPNVGKSTFVNRLVGSRNSIVDDQPGVTRDRIYFDVEWQNKIFTVIDTGGIIPGDEDEIMISIFDQARIACEEADKIIFLVDGKEGVNPVDYDIANILRQSNKPVYLTVNKLDNPESYLMVNDFYSLALGEPIGISALHGSGGVGDLLDIVTEDFKQEEETSQEDGTIKIAIVGRPNAGKSSIVNAILNENRVIVSDISGTTRDSIDSKVEYNVALLVIDATEGISDQDKKISSIITEAGKGLIIAINKWDLIEDKKANTINQFDKKLANDIPFLEFAPKIYISAKTKQRLNQIFDKATEVYEQCTKRISTGLLNKIVKELYALNPPTSVKGKKLKLLYATQAGVKPPTFVLFANNCDLLKDHYKRYIENKFREAFGFYGTPIRINVRERSDKGEKNK